MLRNELIQKEMVDCSQISKSKGKKHNLKHSVYSLLYGVVGWCDGAG